MKKIIALLLALLLIASLAACGESNSGSTADSAATQTADASEPADAQVSGGWAIYLDAPAVELPKDVNDAFNDATAKLDGVSYEPVAYLGRQIVSGNNYAVLCKRTPVTPDGATDLCVLIVYLNIQLESEVINIADFNIVDYVTGEGKTPEQLDGGWTVPDTATKAEIPAEAQTAFDKAAENLDGNDLELMALLGSQVVAGTNYAFLCRSTLVTADPVSSIQVVTVYADLQGNAEITNINTLDIADFNA